MEDCTCSCGQFYGITRLESVVGGEEESTFGHDEDDDDDDCTLVSRFYSTPTTTTMRATSTTQPAAAAAAAANSSTRCPTTTTVREQPFDASFVHLTTPPPPVPSFQQMLNFRESTHHFGASASEATLFSANSRADNHHNNNSNNNDSKTNRNSKSYRNALEYYQQLQWLEQVANSAVVMRNDEDDEPALPSLCVDCAERVLLAMEADTDRLENECRLYRQAMQDEDIRVQALKRAIRATVSSSTPRPPSTTESSSSVSSSSNDDHEEEVGMKDKKEEENQEVDEDKDILLAEAKFQAQLEALKESCRNQQAELDHLLLLRQEQAAMAQDLDMLEWQVQDEANALELQAQAFDNEQEQLHGQLVDTLLEVDQLSSSALRFPAVLYDVRVHDNNNNNNNQQHPQQQQHYPTINELRLAYRPNSLDNNGSSNNVQWTEIQAAWSLAAQLLLAIASLLEFQSQHWKIVPLSHCAKLIYYPPSPSIAAGVSQKSHQQQQQPNHTGGPPTGIVYNLGHPKSNCAQTLVTWNGLLHSMVEHAMAKVAKARERGFFLTSSTKHAGTTPSSMTSMEQLFVIKPLPFAMSANSIGPHRTWPDANDDAGWSRVIHCMSCNLLWLSNLASTLTLQEVMLATCTVPPNYR